MVNMQFFVGFDKFCQD